MIINAKKRLESASDNSFISIQTVKGDYGAFSAEEILEDLSNLNDGRPYEYGRWYCSRS